jgi:hypothetical protein
VESAAAAALRRFTVLFTFIFVRCFVLARPFFEVTAMSFRL